MITLALVVVVIEVAREDEALKVLRNIVTRAALEGTEARAKGKVVLTGANHDTVNQRKDLSRALEHHPIFLSFRQEERRRTIVQRFDVKDLDPG